MKKLLSFLLAGAMLILPLFTGCDAGKPADTTTTTATTETPAPEEPKVSYDSITIGGVDLSQYQIVYAADEYSRVKKNYPDSFAYGDTHYDRLIAEELAATLESMTGVAVPVVSDSKAKTDHEILIGKTSRPQSNTNKSGLSDVYTYRISMLEGKLCINGGSAGATYHALDALYQDFASQNTKDVQIPDGLAMEDTADLITVACVGDSITEGYGCSSGLYCSYPVILQRILWKDYIIYNYGVSGKTMREDLADAYIKTGAYTNMLNGAKKADITLIMLGTNDSNRDRNWNDNSSAKFEEGYRNLLNEIKKRNPDMTYFLMNCPVYGGNDAFGSKTVRDLQKELTDTLIGEGWDLHFYDMYSYTKNVITLKNFPDKLHPGDKGYGMLANGVAEMLEEYRAAEE